ncbi:hypothetical protein KIW84_020381 [Lathyrus oleraceus]|uniref:Ubiquitin-like protease family profile domain-containing protein n=2 Tax=Pisum sativum TaxID=3888 RepID=A0A9D4Y6Z7_PEA|nr:hypothetical protein KIW84_020381 [Pisum sativum]
MLKIDDSMTKKLKKKDFPNKNMCFSLASEKTTTIPLPPLLEPSSNPPDIISYPSPPLKPRPTHKAGKGISRRIESVASQKEVPGRKLKKAGKDISMTSGTKSQIMMRLEKMVEESDIMHGAIRSVDFDEGVFGIAHSEIIAKEDMQQLFEHEELGIDVIHTYIWYMYVTLMRGTELCNRFNFITASRINTTFITKNPTSVKNELVDRFMAAGDNTTPSLYFLPFNSGNGGHWVLVAMDLSRLMVYYLDSLSGDWSKYPSMKKTTHVSSDVATFGVGAVQVLATILTLWLADKSGRRLLLIVSSSAMALSLLVVSISFYLKEYISPDSDLYATLSLVSVAGVVVMVIAFSLGLGAMSWIIMSEILPINIKGLAGSFATLANWFFSWLVTLTANLLLDWSSGGTFTIYTAVCVFTAGFVAIWVPETKGKTLEEIQQFFR